MPLSDRDQWLLDHINILQCSATSIAPQWPTTDQIQGKQTQWVFLIFPTSRGLQTIPFQSAQHHQALLMSPADTQPSEPGSASTPPRNMKGCATNVLPITSKNLAEGLPDIQNDGMVAKIFWTEEERTSEPEILKKVSEIAQQQPTVDDHVPKLLWHCKVKNSTSAVRKALGIADPTKGSRALYIPIFRKLRPITELHGEDFFNVWRQCILCHLALWKGGVHHRDISPPNMMYYRTKNGVLMAVLNDYDLSSLAITPGPQSNERTGTVPFMALDLLSPKGQRGQVKHLYRHDLESFMWVLVWVCLRYRNGVLLPPTTRPFDAWATTDAATCGEKKLWFLNNFLDFEPSDIEPRMWDLVVDCFAVLYMDARDNQRSRIKQRRQSKAGAGEQTFTGESVPDINDFLHKFTSTESWIRLSNNLP
ncbi:hypothetical protein DFH29DRAFT_1014270 [Suillus ampliporus]|nr:hypothetical protein DFH29DRAFT_1014270 [Suillus ampliporus]